MICKYPCKYNVKLRLKQQKNAAVVINLPSLPSQKKDKKITLGN